MQMTWEDTTVETIRDLFRPRGRSVTEDAGQRKRSKRMRYFLAVFGTMHWADRVRRRRIPLARRGHIAL